MNKVLENPQTSPGLAAWMPRWGILAVVIVIFTRRWLNSNLDSELAIRVLVAVSPVPFVFLWARSAFARLRLLDEMQQIITYKAWFLAGLGMMFTMVVLKQAQLAGLNLPEWLRHGLGSDGTFFLMAFLVVIGFVCSNRRYK